MKEGGRRVRVMQCHEDSTSHFWIEDGRQPHTMNVGSIKKMGRSRKDDTLSFSPERPIFDFRVSAL